MPTNWKPAQTFLLSLFTVLFSGAAQAIVGGVIATPKYQGWSSVVGLSDGKTKFCTGTLIAKRIVLTAAHCVNSNERGRFIKVVFAPFPLRTAEVTDVVSHPGYKYAQSEGGSAFTDSIKSENDFALVLLKEEAPPATAMAEVSSLKSLRNNQELRVRTFGYGMINGTTPADGKLRTVELTGEADPDYAGHILFNQRSGQGVCYGDSGGPSFVSGKKQPAVLAVNSHVTGIRQIFNFQIGDICHQMGAAELVGSARTWISETSRQLLQGRIGCSFQAYFDDVLRSKNIDPHKPYDLKYSGTEKAKRENLLLSVYQLRGTSESGKPITTRIRFSAACSEWPDDQ